MFEASLCKMNLCVQNDVMVEVVVVHMHIEQSINPIEFLSSLCNLQSMQIVCHILISDAFHMSC